MFAVKLARGALVAGFLITLSARADPTVKDWSYSKYPDGSGEASVGYLGYLLPARWSRADLYVWYLLGIVPQLIAQFLEVAFGTYLLARRSEQNVRRLRYAIGSLLVTSVISLAIDLRFLKDPTSGVLDGMTILFSAIWLRYFYSSVRVRRVFIERNWVYVETPSRQQTPRERQYVRHRALFWAVVLYILGFVLIGVNQGDKKPDAALLFAVPLVYAAIGGLIAYACPIGKKKRAKLAGNVAAQPGAT
jgi:hypothetical protein